LNIFNAEKSVYVGGHVKMSCYNCVVFQQSHIFTWQLYVEGFTK